MILKKVEIDAAKLDEKIMFPEESKISYLEFCKDLYNGEFYWRLSNKSGLGATYSSLGGSKIKTFKTINGCKRNFMNLFKIK